MALPASILLKSNANSKYLRYSRGSANVSHLRFSQDEDEEMSDIKYPKFEIQSAKVGEGLVHIRATYNYKYLVRKSADENYLVAEASEPEEDGTKWSSTLFKPILLGADSDESRKIQLVHIDDLGERYACVSESEGDLVLRDGASIGTGDDVFMLYDADSVVILPDIVAFVGTNGNIGACGNRLREMSFGDNTIKSAGVPQMVRQCPLKRLVQFTNISNQSRWSLLYISDIGTYVICASNEEKLPPASFVPIKLDDNVIAIYFRDQNRYLNLNTDPESLFQDPMLGSGVPSIVDTARFRLKDPVLDRKVTDVTYDLDNCRIYHIGSEELYHDSYSNHTSVDQTHTFKVEYVKSWSMSWKLSSTWGFIATVMSFTAGIPKVESAGVEVTISASVNRNWGENVTEEETISYDYPVITPPGKKVVLRVITSKARCDVPFKCKMSDTLHDGTESIRAKEGLFTGANQYRVETEKREYALTEAEILAHKQSSNTD